MAQIVEFDWFPEPLVIAGQIDEIAAGLERLDVPLTASLPQVSAAIQRHFLDEGPGWPDWSEKYYPFAEVNNDGILRQSNALFDAASSEDALAVTDDSIVWTGGGVPDMWEWHEFGLPDRVTKSGAPNPLPARPFIGLDSPAEAAITAIFLVWMESVVAGADVSIASVGQSGRRLRGAGGRFIKGV